MTSFAKKTMHKFKIQPISTSHKATIGGVIENKTKPVGALGRLEELALQIAQIQGVESPERVLELVNPHLVVFAADHGITAEGVSPYPAEVTYLMVQNFIGGGAAINVFTRQNKMQLLVVDVGVKSDFAENTPHFLKLKVRKGTENFLHRAAMTTPEMRAAMDAGITVANGAAAKGCNVIGFGEMGIGNTSSAAVLMHLITKLPMELCVGRGTGLDDAGVLKKTTILSQAVANCTLKNTEPLDFLSYFGGLEIAAMVGAMLQAAQNKMLVLVDGFIASSAMLVASEIDSAVLDYAVFCHTSGEKGHARMLEHMHARPLLDLGMRLGEGTGCAVAYPIVQSAVAFYNEMSKMTDLMASR